MADGPMIVKPSRLEEAAIALHEIIWNYTGPNDDWPISIACDDEVMDLFCEAINELGEAVEEVKPGSKPWPVTRFPLLKT